MKIGIDCQSTLGQKTGIGLYTVELVAALRRIAPEHDYLELSWGSDRVMRTDRRLRWQQIELPRRARVAHVDLLHVTGFDAPLWKPCPAVLTIHDLIGPLFPANFPLVARFYWAKWLPRSARFADFVVCDSQNTKADLLRLVPVAKGRVRVIYPGIGRHFQPVGDASLRRALLVKYHLPEKYLLYLGTIEPRKGLQLLVSSYARLAGEIVHDLVIAGKKGWYTEQLFQRVHELGIEHRVHFLDYVPDSDLAVLYTAADLFVFPSTYEGFGLPPLESLACGTPVVCSNISSLPEVVGAAAVLFPPDDEQGLTTAIRKVLNDDGLRQRLRTDGLQRARRFSWDDTARQMLEVYREVHESLH